MGYSVRLITASQEIVPFQDILLQVDSVRLLTGPGDAWEKIEISQPEGDVIALLERLSLSAGGQAENELRILKESLQGSSPASARRWLENYLAGIRVIYTFQLQGETISARGWPVLGKIQNLLKDKLGGIVQADQEGFYNENGDYILWQMYDGATGTIPAAVLNEKGEWIPYQLRLTDNQAVERFKQGIAPEKGFLDRLLRR